MADDEPADPAVLDRYMEAGRCWVAVEESPGRVSEGVPVGYLLATVLDGQAHVDQVTVRPDRQGRGIGRALLDRAAEWGAENWAAALTLTTFRDVPWNRPLYEHLGFRVLTEAEMGPQLRHAHLVEGGPGIDPSTRVAMLREIGAAGDRAAGAGAPRRRGWAHRPTR